MCPSGRSWLDGGRTVTAADASSARSSGRWPPGVSWRAVVPHLHLQDGPKARCNRSRAAGQSPCRGVGRCRRTPWPRPQTVDRQVSAARRRSATMGVRAMRARTRWIAGLSAAAILLTATVSVSGVHGPGRSDGSVSRFAGNGHLRRPVHAGRHVPRRRRGPGRRPVGRLDVRDQPVERGQDQQDADHDQREGRRHDDRDPRRRERRSQDPRDARATSERRSS